MYYIHWYCCHRVACIFWLLEHWYSIPLWNFPVTTLSVPMGSNCVSKTVRKTAMKVKNLRALVVSLPVVRICSTVDAINSFKNLRTVKYHVTKKVESLVFKKGYSRLSRHLPTLSVNPDPLGADHGLNELTARRTPSLVIAPSSGGTEVCLKHSQSPWVDWGCLAQGA